jgi:hypothetical protein
MKIIESALIGKSLKSFKKFSSKTNHLELNRAVQVALVLSPDIQVDSIEVQYFLHLKHFDVIFAAHGTLLKLIVL